MEALPQLFVHNYALPFPSRVSDLAAASPNLLVNSFDLTRSQPADTGSPHVLEAVIPSQSVAKKRPGSRLAKRPSSAKERSRDTRQTVLVVDDVADVTDMLALFLKHAGYNVTTANSAGAALELAGTEHFDLVISDIGMPEMNGYELVESLRTQSQYEATPMIAVTGYTEYDDRGRSLRAGFNAHLTKPINPSQLLELIEGLLNKQTK